MYQYAYVINIVANIYLRYVYQCVYIESTVRFCCWILCLPLQLQTSFVSISLAVTKLVQLIIVWALLQVKMVLCIDNFAVELLYMQCWITYSLKIRSTDTCMTKLDWKCIYQPNALKIRLHCSNEAWTVHLNNLRKL